MPNNLDVDLTTLCTASELANQYPNALNESTIKHYAKHREYNGLAEAGAVFKVGRRLMFSPEHFTAWLVSTSAA